MTALTVEAYAAGTVWGWTPIAARSAAVPGLPTGVASPSDLVGITT